MVESEKVVSTVSANFEFMVDFDKWISGDQDCILFLKSIQMALTTFYLSTIHMVIIYKPVLKLLCLNLSSKHYMDLTFTNIKKKKSL